MIGPIHIIPLLLSSFSFGAVPPRSLARAEGQEHPGGPGVAHSTVVLRVASSRI